MKLSLGFDSSGTKSATPKVDTARRWAMKRQYSLCYQEENVKNAKCSLFRDESAAETDAAVMAVEAQPGKRLSE